MRVLPRLRLLLARRPWLRWLMVGLCAIVVALQLSSAERSLDRERARWGTARTVWVADRNTPAGAPLSFRETQWPEALVPAAALEQRPTAATAAKSVSVGQVLLTDDVADDHTVPTGWAVFAVPADALPALVAGDHVSVFTTGARLCDGRVSPGGATASMELAVPADCASALATALANGDLVVARNA